VTGGDAASLTALLRDYGQLWEITRTAEGVRAQQRRSPAPPAVFTAATVPALRELLEHGYDPATLTAVNRDHGGHWQVEHIDPGTAWIALSRGDGGPIQVIAAKDLATLQGSLGRSPGEAPGAAAGQRRSSATPGPDADGAQR
jgi:hypothetical protein